MKLNIYQVQKYYSIQIKKGHQAFPSGLPKSIPDVL